MSPSHLVHTNFEKETKEETDLDESKEQMDEKVKEEKDSVYKFKKELGGVMYAAPIINLTYMPS